MLNFCTLYNSNYAAKGLAMYWSLKRVCPEFRLYVFAFDDILADALRRMALPEVAVIPLSEFEDEELLRVKPTRTAGEYCWTCSSSTIYYCIKRYNLDICTYIDADLYFYSNPQVLIDEMGDDDVLITEHRYTPSYDQTETSGKYCVQFMTFKNTERGMKILLWWRERCLEWCYARLEEGKFGDQKYLDDWMTRFSGVHELQNLGGGVAPWNMQQYHFKITHSRNNCIQGCEIKSGKTFDLVFFHFHNCMSFWKRNFREFVMTHYDVDKNAIEVIFKPYIHILIKAYYFMRKYIPNNDGLASSQQPICGWKNYLRQIIKRFIHKEIRFYYWLGPYGNC